MNTQAEPARRDESAEWWLRALLVAQAPRQVFAELRDDSREAAEDRQDVVAAIAFFVGLALTLLTAQASNFADDPARKGIVIPVWLFIAGLLVGVVNYWLAGGVLYLALDWLGARTTYRQARHLLALAAVPLALSLVLLAIVIRVVNRWSWGRTAAAVGVFGLLVALVDLALSVLGG